MSGFGGVDLSAAATTGNGVANFSEHVDHVDGTMRSCAVCLKQSAMPGPEAELPGTISNMVNGPLNKKPHRQNCKHMFDGHDGSNKCAVDTKDVRKCSEFERVPNSHLEKSHREDEASSDLRTNEHFGQEKAFPSDRCQNSESIHLDKQITHVQLGNCGDHVAEIANKETDVLSETKLKINTKNEPTTSLGLANGSCRCHHHDHVDTSKGKSLNSAEKADPSASSLRKSVKPGPPNMKHQKEVNKKDLTCNSNVNNTNEPLASLSKMVEDVCLDGENSQGATPSKEKLKLDASQDEMSCADNGATCGDLLTGIDPSFGAIGPAGADLDDTELEELPSSLSDFVLGCHDDQYAVPPFPPNDSDIDTIHIETDPDSHPITLVPYESEVQMPDIMRLITKDLSEPYSIYTYRYFIHNWPQLCFLAMHQDKCVGAIVCKLDIHKKMTRRGYIAMLAVDENYRKRQIGSSLVKKAIRAMVRGDCDEVVLETEITNKPALRLYENLGFLRDKRLFRYYLNGVDALRLKLWLR